MRLKFAYNKKLGIIRGRINLDARFAGPPGYCHGGIIATVLDEAMAKLNKPNGVLAVTGHLAIDYRRPVPLGKFLRVEASETEVKGRRRLREGKIMNKEGEVLASGTGIFIAIERK